MAPYSLVFNGTVAIVIEPWEVAGSYFEACNCDAVCPCRRVDGRAGGRSTHGVCQFALSWQISRGAAGALSLDGLAVVMAGWYDDDEHGSPWRVILYVDESANREQHDALAAIFLGQRRRHNARELRRSNRDRTRRAVRSHRAVSRPSPLVHAALRPI